MLCDSVYMKCPEKSNLETESRSIVIQGWEWEQGLPAKKHNENFWGDRNDLKLECGDDHTTL